jgi:AcrR family transcriptional regulator
MSDTAPRRGRPRAFDPEVALKKASDAFKAQGYASTSLDDIARATGLNRPSLYAAFGDKKALYVAALQRLWGAIDKQFAALEAANLPLTESIARILQGSIDAYTAGPSPQGCLAICTATAEAPNDPEIRAQLDRVLALMDDRIGRFYARAGDNDPEGKAHLLAGVLHSMSVRARAGQPRAVLERMAQAAVATLT